LSELAVTEREKYRAVWDMPVYRVKSHSLALWNMNRDVFPEMFVSALDIGCGLGRLFGHLNDEGFDAWAFDIADNALEPEIREQWGHKFRQGVLWDMVWDRRFDVGVCTDVMEHIPECHVPAVLLAIAECCDVTIFKIANFPSRSLGLDLHLTMRDAEWWTDQMQLAGGVVERLDIATSKTEYFFRWTCV